jgi:hypothetical protein
VFCNVAVAIVDSYGKLLSEDVSFPDFFLEGGGLHFRTFIISCSCTHMDLNLCCYYEY